MVPIQLSRESVQDPYTISVPSVDEEVIVNPALLAKLKQDFEIDLPAPPDDWEEQGLISYFNNVNEYLKKAGWKVEQL